MAKRESEGGRSRKSRVDLRLSESEERKLDALVGVANTMVEGSTKTDVLRALIGEAYQSKVERAPKSGRRAMP